MRETRVVAFARYALKRTGLHGLARPMWHALANAARAPIYQHRGQHLERLVLFIGYPRSGSSFVSALLNSHPEVVISQEGTFPAVDKLLEATAWRKWRIMHHILDHDRHTRDNTGYRKMGNGYSLAVNSPWQGTYSRLRVLGYKNADKTTECLHRWPSALDALRRSMEVPVTVLFTYRNPYDMIAADYLRRLKREGCAIPDDLSRFSPTAGETPSMAQTHFSASTKHFDLSRRLASVLALFAEDEVLPVKHEDFVASPRDSLRRLCRFLGVEYTEDYLRACAAIAYPSPHQTRFKVRWTAGQRAQVEELIRRHPWFAGYAFEN